jgi:hypothetical protein
VTYEIKLTVRVTTDKIMSEAIPIIENALLATKQVYIISIDRAERARQQ